MAMAEYITVGWLTTPWLSDRMEVIFFQKQVVEILRMSLVPNVTLR
jgi:hypothetical protein